MTALIYGIATAVCAFAAGYAIARNEQTEQDREAHQLRDRQRAARWL